MGPMNSTSTTDVIRVPHNDDIRVEGLQGVFRPPRRHVHCLGDLGTEQALDGVDNMSGHELPPYTR